jgi:hypothetical protein
MRRKDGAPGAFVAGAIGPTTACRPTSRVAHAVCASQSPCSGPGERPRDQINTLFCPKRTRGVQPGYTSNPVASFFGTATFFRRTYWGSPSL